MSKRIVDAAGHNAPDARVRPRELAAELASFIGGLVVLFAAVGIHGAWFSPAPVVPETPATSTSVTTDTSSADLRIDTLVWTVFTGPEWPGAGTTR